MGKRKIRERRNRKKAEKQALESLAQRKLLPEEEIPGGLVEIFNAVKTKFPKGATNRLEDRNLNPLSRSIIRAYIDRIDEDSAVIDKKYRSEVSLPTLMARTQESFEIIRRMRQRSECNPQFRTDHLDAIDKRIASFGGFGLCGDMVRIAFAEADRIGVPAACIQVCDPEDPRALYHEVLLIHFSAAELEAFESKKYVDCGNAVVFDPWDCHWFYAKNFASEICALSKRQALGIFRGDVLDDPSKYDLMYTVSTSSLRASAAIGGAAAAGCEAHSGAGGAPSEGGGAVAAPARAVAATVTSRVLGDCAAEDESETAPVSK